MNYRVEIKQEGRGGWVYYVEDEQRLSFDWDFTTIGIAIDVPTPEKWDALCKKQDADRAMGRRQEILERVAEEVRRKKAKTAKVSIEDSWIQFSFEGSWTDWLLSQIPGK